MPVRPEIAERYEALDGKPDELTWEGIDAFAAEMAQAYGGRSLEYAHALALYARKARWTGKERERSRAAMDIALSIVGTDLRVPNQIWWRHLQCLICHDLGDGAGAVRFAREMQEWSTKSNYEVASLKYYQGIVYALEAWTEPAFRTLRQLSTIWKAIDEKNRKELRKLVNEVAERRAGLRDDEKAMYAAITTEEGGLTAAMSRATPEANAEALKAALADLDALTGLHAVKAQVRRLVAQLRMREARKAAGLPLPDATHHMAFLGPPGTGKTTVARLLGRIFCALGILPSDNLVETDRAGLVAQYVGQTAPKVHAKVDEAIGGVLFIDEAYTLAPSHGNDFGHEAIAALLKRMEDDRHKLVVVLAGYDEEMQALFDSNPGLRSRVPTQLNFRAYSGSELHAILSSMLRHQGFVLSPTAEAR
ncbi:MAG: Stage sporulation protein, partial [Pseudomonadota bacterium]